MTEGIYLDNAATSPMYPEVIDVMIDALRHDYGNASSTHRFGRRSRGLLDEARMILAKSIQAKPNEIIITSGGTESDNTAILKSAEKMKDIGKHIITTNIEHQAVLQPMKYLEEHGYEVTYLPVDQKGIVSPNQVQEAIREDTILVSIMYGNNEVGSIMPIAEIGKLLKERDPKILFHTDAVQAYGTVKLDVEDLNVDLLSVSAHKIGGPKGIGFLYSKAGTGLPSLLMGGEQETKKRAGTENIPAIVGFKKAVEMMMDNLEERVRNYQQLKTTLIDQLTSERIDYQVNGSLQQSLPQIVSLHLEGLSAERLLVKLDIAGIAVSAGSACTAGTIDPSHVLTAMYQKDHPAISETIRVSMGHETTEQDILALVNLLKLQTK
ncbi:cysteine desulfurase family protein [Marinilactibacillus kalidii]|uniref:cysteine desulfurase family protein n=1 Tax=Marinilactibacillus kalidii TaxID=2820274 RepID=UPI001ABE156E|nr:cysteine desulfurase family protein [Marinilactibacillus kalidii]